MICYTQGDESGVTSLCCVLTTLNFSSPTNCLQEGKLGKEVFMRQLRSVAGDELLRSTILEIRG